MLASLSALPLELRRSMPALAVYSEVTGVIAWLSHIACITFPPFRFNMREFAFLQSPRVDGIRGGKRLCTSRTLPVAGNTSSLQVIGGVLGFFIGIELVFSPL